MKQYEPCIQNNNNNNNNNNNTNNNNTNNNNNNNNNNNRIKTKKRKEKSKASGEREREEREGKVFVGAEGKVDPCNEIYAWVPKSWSFVKLHKVENFHTCVISNLKVI